MAWVNYTDNEFERKQPLKFRAGDEKAKTIVENGELEVWRYKR